jgi:hypothetical protein
MSYKAEVIADNSNKWCPNGLAFATHEEARKYGDNLMWRWMAVREVRVVESDQPVNAAWDDSKPYPAALTHDAQGL